MVCSSLGRTISSPSQLFSVSWQFFVWSSGLGGFSRCSLARSSVLVSFLFSSCLGHLKFCFHWPTSFPVVPSLWIGARWIGKLPRSRYSVLRKTSERHLDCSLLGVLQVKPPGISCTSFLLEFSSGSREVNAMKCKNYSWSPGVRLWPHLNVSEGQPAFRRWNTFLTLKFDLTLCCGWVLWIPLLLLLLCCLALLYQCNFVDSIVSSAGTRGDNIYSSVS